MTPTEVFFLLYIKTKLDHRKQQREYEMMRIQTFFSLMPSLNKNIRDEKQLMPFIWDKLPFYKKVDEITDQTFLDLEKVFSKKH